MAAWPLTPPDGAYELGGGDFSYGQDMTEAYARSLFEIPDFNAANALTVLPQLLLRLPLEALKRFEAFIPNVVEGAFETVTGAVEAIMGALENSPRMLVQLIEMIATIPLNALNLFGHILPHLLTQVPAGAISGTTPNLLPDTGFAEGSIAPNPAWLVDLTKSRTADGTGAAKVVADGTTKALRSGRSVTDTIPVSAGQTFSSTVYVSHEDYVGTGPAVLLQVVPYIGDAPVAPQLLASYTPTAPTLAWPGYELTGSYVVPEGVTGVQVRDVLTAESTAGTFYLDDPAGRQTGKLRMEWMDGLPEALQDLLGRWQLQLDTIVNTLRNTSTYLHTVEELAEALVNIPAAAISGILGGPNIGADALDILNAFVGGLVGKAGSGATTADAFNIANIISSLASLGGLSWEKLGIRNAEPVASGMLATGDSNFPYANANTWVPVTQSASLAVTHRVGKSRAMGVISWLGYGKTGITDFRVIVRKISPADGSRTLVHVSPNLASLLPPGSTVADANWVFYEIDESSTIAQLEGDDFHYQLVAVGGTHYVRGLSYADNIPDHPYAQVKSLGSVHNETSPATPASIIAKSAVTSSQNVMWIETAIETGNGSNHHEPMMVYLGTEPTTVQSPPWVDTIQAIAVGDGGGAHLGGSYGFAGDPGEPGKFATAIWKRGVDFTTPPLVTFTPGPGGSPGANPINQVGGDGEGSTLSIPGHSVTAEGGKGGKGIRFVPTAGKPVGRGPGVFEFDGREFKAGSDQNAYSGDGVAPGGAANGGNFISVTSGGRGAPGGGWVVFLPGDAPSSTPVENTPPTAPTVSLAGATFSTLSFNISGATDA